MGQVMARARRGQSLGDLGEVLERAHHVRGEAVLVVVEGDGADHGHAVHFVDVGLRRIEDATVGVADDVAGDDLVIVVAVVRRILEGVLERGVDLVDGGFLVEHGEELGDRSVGTCTRWAWPCSCR